MVVIRRSHGFRFAIYTDDHEPADVHIIGVGLAKIHLLGPHGRPEIVDVIGIKRSDMQRLLAEATEHCDEFMREWERIHGRSE